MNRKLGRRLWIIAGLYWTFIFALTHVPTNVLPEFNIWDKYEHMGAYAGLGAALFFALWITRPHLPQLGILVLAIGMAYGAIDELLQIPVGRDCEFADWMADTTGLAIAIICLTWIRAWRSEKQQMRHRVTEDTETIHEN